MDYDWIILGAGPGGYEAAIRAAQLKQKVALVEKGEVGGTCLNRGCVPTKALLHAAMGFEELDMIAGWGIQAEQLTLDFGKMYARKDELVSTLRDGIGRLIAQNGITLMKGEGVIRDSHTVLAGDKVLTAERILIATGSTPVLPKIPGIDFAGVVTSDGLLSAPPVGQRLIIIGGGVIGVEFASMFQALGYEVTVIEALERLLPQMDREISQNLGMLMKKRGTFVYTGARVSEIQKNDDGSLTVLYEAGGKQGQSFGDTVLVAIGRRANTQGLFAEGFSLETDRGRIVTDSDHQTSEPGVYAIGDVSGTIQLAHAASAQGIACVERAAGHTPHVRVDLVPSCVYTRPEIACVGLTADEAKAKGIPVRTGKYILSANCRTMIAGGERGFVKLVLDEATDVLLGAQIVCERATDMINEMTLAIANGLTRQQLLKAIRPHPTFAESVTEALDSVEGMAIHMAPARKA
jgi:dihydrolipoamide dehydrogenase